MEIRWCLGERWLGIGVLTALLVSYIIHCSIQAVVRLFPLARCSRKPAVFFEAQMYATLYAMPLDHARRERYVGGGTLSVSQTASRSSSRPAQPARAEPKLHASITFNININIPFRVVLISTRYPILYYLLVCHHIKIYGALAFSTAILSVLHQQ